MANSQDPSVPVAIVTGGVSGIGLAIAQHFVSINYTVIVFDIDRQSDAEIIAQVRGESSATVLYQRCSVSDWDDLANAFKIAYEHTGRIDIVFANAGIAEIVPSQLSKAELEPTKPDLKVLDVNLMGVIFTTRLASYYMSKNPQRTGLSRGSIICTSSMAGLYPFPISPLYSASKFGVIGFVRSMGPVLAKHDIQINALAPAVLDTNIFTEKAALRSMRVTPKSTLIRGVMGFLDNPKIAGEVAEIHGEDVTLRPPHEIIDEHEKKNLDEFWKFTFMS